MNITKINNDHLDLINMVASVDIEQGYSIKDFYPKIIERFKEYAWIAYQDYPLYRLTCNTFENTIIKGESCEKFFNLLNGDIYPIEQLQIEKIVNYTHNKKSIELYKDIRYYFNKRIEDYLCSIIEQRTNENSLELIAKGKTYLLSNYLSNISILYGLRNASENVFIFYYQSHYNRFLDLLSYLKESCIKHLHNTTDIVFSFRFINEKYIEEMQTALLMDQFLSYKPHFNNIILSSLSNIGQDENMYKNEFIINNNIDLVG